MKVQSIEKTPEKIIFHTPIGKYIMKNPNLINLNNVDDYMKQQILIQIYCIDNFYHNHENIIITWNKFGYAIVNFNDHENINKTSVQEINNEIDFTKDKWCYDEYF